MTINVLIFNERYETEFISKVFPTFFWSLPVNTPLHRSLLFYITTTAIAFAEILTLRGLSLKWWSTILNWIVLLCKNYNAPHQRRRQRWTEFQTDGTRELRASKNIGRNHLLLWMSSRHFTWQWTYPPAILKLSISYNTSWVFEMLNFY